MLPAFAFANTGFLLGLLIAFSSDHLAAIVVPLLFSVFGGSVIAFGEKISAAQRRVAYWSLLTLSGSCAVGLIIGVLCVHNQWLGPANIETASAEEHSKPEGKPGEHFPGKSSSYVYTYVRGIDIDKIDGIKMLVAKGELDKSKAYDQLVDELGKAKGQ